MQHTIPGVKGSGTEGDPFLVTTPDVFNIATEASGLYFMLSSDINCTNTPWYGYDLNNGYLDMNNHKILAPPIELTSRGDKGYLFKNARIYGNKMKYDSDGKEVVSNPPASAGYFMNVRGEQINCLFENVELERIYVDARYTSCSNTPFKNVTMEQCNIILYNGQRERDVLFTAPPRLKDIGPWINSNAIPGFIDTRFEINGYVPNKTLFMYETDSPQTSLTLLDHCIISGLVDCSRIEYAADSSLINLVHSGVKSCLFMLKTDTIDDERGYKRYAGSFEGVNLSIHSHKKASDPFETVDGRGVFIGDRFGVYEIDDDVFYNPNKLNQTGLDIVVKAK